MRYLLLSCWGIDFWELLQKRFNCLSFLFLNIVHIFQCMDKIFTWHFKGFRWNSTQTIWPMKTFLIKIKILKDLRFKSVFQNPSGNPSSIDFRCFLEWTAMFVKEPFWHLNQIKWWIHRDCITHWTSRNTLLEIDPNLRICMALVWYCCHILEVTSSDSWIISSVLAFFYSFRFSCLLYPNGHDIKGATY